MVIRFLTIIFCTFSFLTCLEMKAQERPDKAWLNDLNEIYGLEVQSIAQYQADSARFNQLEPYNSIIRQKYNHIRVISSILTSYGIRPSVEPSEIKTSATLAEAYLSAMQQEEDIILKLDDLLQDTENERNEELLQSILGETIKYSHWFNRALTRPQGEPVTSP